MSNFLTIALTGIVGLVIYVAVIVFIVKDANRRGMEPTIYVVLTCCCGLLIGGIVYLITASNHPIQTGDFQKPSFNGNQGQVYGQQQTTYGQPQYQQPRQQAHPKPAYPDTSTTIPSFDNTLFCSICGSQNQKNAKYCSTCGADLK